MRKALEQAKAGRLHILGIASFKHFSFDLKPLLCTDYLLWWIELLGILFYHEELD